MALSAYAGDAEDAVDASHAEHAEGIGNVTLLTTKDLQALIHVDKSTIYRMAGRRPSSAMR